MPSFPQLPIVESFVIPSDVNWEYIDRRELSSADYQTVTDLWCSHADARLAELPGKIPVCGNDGFGGTLFHEDGLRRWDRARILRPGLSFSDFEIEGGTRQRETDPIATKPQLFFGVRQGRTWIGGVPMSNLNIEFEDRTRIEASFFVPTATPAMPGRTRAQSNALGLRWLLNNDLRLRDGRILDLVQWDFTLPKALEVVMRADPSIIQNFVELGNEFEQRGGTGSTSADMKLTFRRRTAKAPPDETEPPVDETEPPRERPTARPISTGGAGGIGGSGDGGIVLPTGPRRR